MDCRMTPSSVVYRALCDLAVAWDERQAAIQEWSAIRAQDKESDMGEMVSAYNLLLHERDRLLATLAAVRHVLERAGHDGTHDDAACEALRFIAASEGAA